MQLFLHFVQLVVKMLFELEHIGPLARFVDLYDYICVFIKALNRIFFDHSVISIY